MCIVLGMSHLSWDVTAAWNNFGTTPTHDCPFIRSARLFAVHPLRDHHPALLPLRITENRCDFAVIAHETPCQPERCRGLQGTRNVVTIQTCTTIGLQGTRQTSSITIVAQLHMDTNTRGMVNDRRTQGYI
jgi:hypothetical protein